MKLRSNPFPISMVIAVVMSVGLSPKSFAGDSTPVTTIHSKGASFNYDDPEPSTIPLPLADPYAIPEVPKKITKPKVEEESGPGFCPSCSLLFSPRFYFTKLSATDSNQNQVTLFSEAVPGFDLGLVIRWSSDWRTRLIVGGSAATLDINSDRDTLDHPSQILWHAGFEIEKNLDGTYSIALSSGVSKQLFVDRSSFNSLGIENLIIPEVSFKLMWQAAKFSRWIFRPSLAAGILLPSSGSGSMSADTGFMLRAELPLETQHLNRGMGFFIYFENREQNTSLTSASSQEVGLCIRIEK